ncbi:hypothetical protein THTE_0752 [Thermogutta terrifontis]|uniref:Uncharacterized protein n=1 Tax=Thermogutta terrifontis TaxID=1331910 RepID=A0A286RBK5_9BACT|nr:hypothetical protein THTE_0752 [Thermogutta terrifontis]
MDKRPIGVDCAQIPQVGLRHPNSSSADGDANVSGGSRQPERPARQVRFCWDVLITSAVQRQIIDSISPGTTSVPFRQKVAESVSPS